MTVFWSRWSTRERVFLGIFGAVLVTAVIQQGVLHPLEDYVDKLDARIQSREIKLARYRRRARMDIRGMVTSQAFSEVKTSGTAKEEMSAFLVEIEKMARKSSVRIMNVRPLPIERKGDYETLIVEVHSDASLISFTHFMYELDHSPEEFRVPRFALSAAENLGRLHADFAVLRTLKNSSTSPRRSGEESPAD